MTIDMGGATSHNPGVSQTVLHGPDVDRAVADMARTIHGIAGDGPWAVVGIRRGGDHLAARLALRLPGAQGGQPPVGVVDITLYRDDGFGPHQYPKVGVTHIPFDLTAHTVVLVDDVLFTGRTVRAALDVIADYGRPRAVRLAVLVDRGLRELPIRADAVGVSLQTTSRDHVDVQLREAGATVDAVVLSSAGASP